MKKPIIFTEEDIRKGTFDITGIDFEFVDYEDYKKLEKERDRLKELVDISIKLCLFVKMHEYPKEFSQEFNELTGLFDMLETKLYSIGFNVQQALKEK